MNPDAEFEAMLKDFSDEGLKDKIVELAIEMAHTNLPILRGVAVFQTYSVQLDRDDFNFMVPLIYQRKDKIARRIRLCIAECRNRGIAPPPAAQTEELRSEVPPATPVAQEEAKPETPAA